MKLQFRLMSLALIVFASNVQAVGEFEEVSGAWNRNDFVTKMKLLFSPESKDFRSLLMSKEFAKEALEVAKNSKMAIAKETAKVAIPVAAVVALYKLNKAGKLETIKAKSKQAVKNVGSWINTHRKTTAALVAFGALSAYGYKYPSYSKTYPLANTIAASPVQGVYNLVDKFKELERDSYITRARNAILHFKN